MAAERKSYLSRNRSVDLMHQGAVLRLMHIGGDRQDWHIIHRAGGPVKPGTAAQIMAMPDVVASNDGLFPDCSQTFRLMKREVA